MINDFFDGALANQEAAEQIVAPIETLLDYARQNADWVVVYANDAHFPDDAELALWGEHALAGTPGAEVIDRLAPAEGEREIVAPKRGYSAFDNEDLLVQLRELGVDELVLTGQHTNCCVQHTAYDGFRHGFKVTVVSDATTVPPGADQDQSIAYLVSVYGAEVTTSTALTA
jgi:nicotinamidase-related amidase